MSDRQPVDMECPTCGVISKRVTQKGDSRGRLYGNPTMEVCGHIVYLAYDDHGFFLGKRKQATHHNGPKAAASR